MVTTGSTPLMEIVGVAVDSTPLPVRAELGIVLGGVLALE